MGLLLVTSLYRSVDKKNGHFDSLSFLFSLVVLKEFSFGFLRLVC